MSFVCLMENSIAADPALSLAPPPPAKGCIRVATFNVALNRKENGQLVRDLKAGDEQAKKIAEEASKKLLANPVMEYFEISETPNP